jgi:pyruvate/2-oxoglutarate dehydrogenase complex dihydrolipoamide acyltransferase (E2) component
MATEIRIPKLGVTSEEATLAAWIAVDGAQVTQGDVLYSLETDKAVQEIEAPASGKLQIIGKVGEAYPIGHLIGLLE